MPRTLTRGRGLIALLGLLSAVGPLSIDMYLPSLPSIASDLGAHSAVVQQSVSAFFLGLAAGQIAYGPLSDRFGRRPALFAGIAVYLVASLACAAAGDINTLIAARAMQGLGAAASAVAGRAIIRDVWEGNEAARVMSFVIMVMAIGPLMAPIVGGQILVFAGWRGIFWVLTAFALLVLCMIAFRLPETNGPDHRGDVRLAPLFRAYGHLLGDPHVLAYLACGGLVYAAMFAYITGAPFVYIEVFGVDPQYFGFYFALNVIGITAGNYLNSQLVMRLGYRRMLGLGATVAMISSLALLGVALSGRGGLLTVVILLFFAVSTVGVVGANTVAGLLELYPRNAGAASALFGLFQFGLGALSGVAVGALNDGTPVAMGAVMAIAATGAFFAHRWLKRLGAQRPVPVTDDAPQCDPGSSTSGDRRPMSAPVER